MKPTYDVLIAGGGMVGATLAGALGNSRLKIGVIEPQPAGAPGKDSGLRVSAITLASQTVFENIGAWEAMHTQRCSRVEAMRIWEDRHVLHFDSADIGEPCLAWIIENHVMVTALAERLRQFPNIELISPARLNTVQFSAACAQVTLEDGRRLETRLLVGADGAESRVRRAAAIDWTRHDLTQSAIVAVVQTERSHDQTAYQHFLPTGPLAFLPLADAHSVSIVWSADQTHADTLMALADDDFNCALQTAFGDRLGRVQLASRRASLPLALGFARDYCRPRVALIGDAAHTVHPLAGQGVNLGILDAAVLSEILLSAAPPQRDPGAHALLRRYERTRKGADRGMQIVTGGFRYLFGSRVPGVAAVRTAGLDIAQQLPVLKQFFMRRASGLEGELPRLAQRLQR